MIASFWRKLAQTFVEVFFLWAKLTFFLFSLKSLKRGAG